MRSTAPSTSAAIRRCMRRLQAQRHARRRLLARPGAALRRALSRLSPGPPNERRCRRPRRRRHGANGLEAALVLPNAERASLCVYERASARRSRADAARRDDGVLRGVAPGFGAGARYGLRVEGPFDPARGAALRRLQAAGRSLRLARSTGRSACIPRCSHSATTAGRTRRRRSPARRRRASRAASASRPRRSIIYELNLRGFSRLNPAIPEAARGTFAGLAHPASIAHLAALGVTAVEIMPADAFIDERHLPPLGLSNAWGYNSVVFGAPDPRLAPGGWAEVRAATDALHAAGHGGDPRRRPQPQRRERRVRADAVVPRPRQRRLFPPRSARSGALHQRHRACGNCLALDRPLVIDMAIGALQALDDPRRLRRLPLRSRAPTLGRRDDGFDPNAPFFAGARRRSGARQRRA